MSLCVEVLIMSIGGGLWFSRVEEGAEKDNGEVIGIRINIE